MNIEKRVSLHKTYGRFALILLFCYLITNFAYAGFEKQQQSSRALGMGNAITALSTGVGSLFYNPANIINTHEREGFVFYSPAPFDLKELAIGAAGYIEPTSIGTFGISFQTSGYELYREIGAGISYAHAYKNFRYGMTLNYYSLSIERYGSTGIVSIDLGVNADITDQVSIGAVVYNLNQPTIGDVKERLPFIFSTGVVYKPIDELLLCADVQKDMHYPVNVRIGAEYTPVPFIHFRIGNSTEPSRFSASIGISYEMITVDYAIQTHTDLGMTHSFSLGVRLSSL